MDTEILENGNPGQVRDYAEKKFRGFKSSHFMSKPERDRWCVSYYLCASKANQQAVQDAYFATFRKAFPQSQADQTRAELVRKGQSEKTANTIGLVEQIEQTESRLNSAQQLQGQLDLMLRNEDYQGMCPAWPELNRQL